MVTFSSVSSVAHITSRASFFRTLDFNRSLEPVATFDNKTTHIGLSAFLTFLSLMCGHLNLLELMQGDKF